MRYLSVEEVLFIHFQMVERFGGSHGVRDLGLLESAVARPQSGFGGEEIFPSLFEKAAALMDAIIRNHPFVDGNKRTGISAAGMFLQLNEHRLLAANTELEEFTVQSAVEKPPIETLAAWFERHSDRA